METRRLEFFLDLVETKNYSETAERMYTTQGNVSKQIRALEKELDTQLFDRSHRRIRLTAAGEQILPFARTIVENEKQMEKGLLAFLNREKSMLKIYAIPVMSQYRVTELLAGFKKEYPGILVQLAEAEKKSLRSSLDEGSCDVIYTRNFEEDKEDEYENIFLEYDSFAAVLPKDHPLSGKARISLEELKGESFLLLDEQTGLLQKVLEMCRSAGFEPEIAYKGNRIETILGMAASKMGVAVLMEKTVSEERIPGIRKIPLENTVQSMLVFERKKKKRHTRALEAFWNYVSGCNARTIPEWNNMDGKEN